MFKNILKKLIESIISVLPIAGIVSIVFGLQFTVVFPDNSLPTHQFVVFLASIVTVAVGMTLFSLGSDIAMTKVGHYIGSNVTKKKSLIFLIVIGFILGAMITIAEPDLTVLSDLLSTSVNPWVLKLVIGGGVGVFLVFGLLRIIFQKSLKSWLIFLYFIVFALAALLDGPGGEAIFSITFDSGGVTTGPVTVPFLLTFGAGVAMVRGGKDSSSDSFGVMGLCSVGPLIATMLLLIIMSKTGIDFSILKNAVDASPVFINVLVATAIEIVIAIAPVLIFFLIYNFVSIKLPSREILRILLGFVYTYVGLTIFLTSAKYGMIPVADFLGSALSNPVFNGRYHYLLYIISIFLGFAVVLVEPGVHVLTEQVEEVSARSISKRKILVALCIGVALAICLAVTKYLFSGISIIYLYVPLYVIAILLTFTVPDIYTAIAFDSGGVASGSMSSCFVLPFIIGIASAEEGRGTGFGVIGLISIMPIICVQVLGLSSKIKTKIAYNVAKKRVKEADDVQVVHLA